MIWFLYDTATAQIQAVGQREMGWTGLSSSQAQISFADDDPVAQAAYHNPAGWIIQNGQLVQLPYWTVTQSTASDTITVTATLTNPPATLPTSATATVGQTTLTLPVTNGSVTLVVQRHPSLQSYACPITICAAGTAPATTTIGAGPTPSVGLQALAPSLSGDPYRIAPAGPGSTAFLQAHYAAQVPEVQQPADIATAVSLLMEMVYGQIVPALQKSGALTLDANTQNLLTDVTTNILPAIPVTLATAAPAPASGQTPTYDPHYAQMRQDYLTAGQAMAAFAQDLATLPGLA